MSAATVTAQIGYQPPVAGRRPGPGTWHAVVTSRVKVGWVTRQAGEALCGLVPLADAPPVLFAAVTCPACRAIAAREHIHITGGAL